MLQPRVDWERHIQELVRMRFEVLVDHSGESILELGAQLTQEVNEGVRTAWLRSWIRVEDVTLGGVDKKSVGPGGNYYGFTLESDNIQIEQITLELSVTTWRVPAGVVELLNSLRVRRDSGQEVVQFRWLGLLRYTTNRYKDSVGDGREDRGGFVSSGGRLKSENISESPQVNTCASFIIRV